MNNIIITKIIESFEVRHLISKLKTMRRIVIHDIWYLILDTFMQLHSAYYGKQKYNNKADTKKTIEKHVLIQNRTHMYTFLLISVISSLK